jgi:hypothetical protein
MKEEENGALDYKGSLLDLMSISLAGRCRLTCIYFAGYQYRRITNKVVETSEAAVVHRFGRQTPGTCYDTGPSYPS